MIGKLKDYQYTRSGSTVISFETEENVAELYDELQSETVTVDIKKFHKKRSLNANAYAWVLIDKLAERLNLSKTEVYRETIRDIGGVSTAVCVKEEVADEFRRLWTSRGLGWQVEAIPSKLEKCVTFIAYKGSSEYDGAQMGRLIDHLIQDCEAVGIPTMTDEQVSQLVARWAKKKEAENETGEADIK